MIRPPALVFVPALALLAALAAAPAAAQASLDEAVRARVAERWGVDPALVAVEIDPAPEGWAYRPGAALALEGSGAGGRWTLRVDAKEGPTALALRLRAGTLAPVAVAAHDLARDRVVGAEDMETATEIRWGEPGGEVPPSPEGWSTQRLIRKGEPLREPAVRPPLLVRPGQALELVWRRGAVSVRVGGTAAGAAPLGGEVQVRTDSGRRLRGVVVAPGVVDVTNAGEEE